MSFERDFQWQGRLLPRVKQVILAALPNVATIAEASFEEDAKHNTDLVLKIEATRVSCRLRRSEYTLRYPDEFTIRSGRPSGAQTELAKMLSGWGDYVFYGFADPGDVDLTAWFLGDLKVFRLWHHRSLTALPAGRAPGSERTNKKDGTKFRAYRISELPPEFVVARQLLGPAAGAA